MTITQIYESTTAAYGKGLLLLSAMHGTGPCRVSQQLKCKLQWFSGKSTQHWISMDALSVASCPSLLTCEPSVRSSASCRHSARLASLFPVANAKKAGYECSRDALRKATWSMQKPGQSECASVGWTISACSFTVHAQNYRNSYASIVRIEQNENLHDL